MVQILRPDATIDRAGWTDQAGGTTNIHLKIDEVTPSDADYVKDQMENQGGGGDPDIFVPTELIKFGFTEAAEEPDLSGTFIVRFRHQVSGGFLAGQITAYLYQDATLIGQRTVNYSTTAITTTWTLSTSERAKITTGGDFRIWFIGNPTSGGGTIDMRVTWTEFQLPDAASGGGGGEPPPPPPGGSSPDQRDLKVWTMNIDGHHFYLLNLGDFGTLVYDTITGQWSEWQSDGENRFLPSVGKNWGEEVLAGSFDDAQTFIVKTGRGFDFGTTPIVRIVRGKLPMRTRATAQCKAVHFTGSARRGATVQLKTSDDGGKTFIDHGIKTID